MYERTQVVRGKKLTIKLSDTDWKGQRDTWLARSQGQINKRCFICNVNYCGSCPAQYIAEVINTGCVKAAYILSGLRENEVYSRNSDYVAMVKWLDGFKWKRGEPSSTVTVTRGRWWDIFGKR